MAPVRGHGLALCSTEVDARRDSRRASLFARLLRPVRASRTGPGSWGRQPLLAPADLRPPIRPPGSLSAGLPGRQPDPPGAVWPTARLAHLVIKIAALYCGHAKATVNLNMSRGIAGFSFCGLSYAPVTYALAGIPLTELPGHYFAGERDPSEGSDDVEETAGQHGRPGRGGGHVGRTRREPGRRRLHHHRQLPGERQHLHSLAELSLPAATGSFKEFGSIPVTATTEFIQDGPTTGTTTSTGGIQATSQITLS